MPENKWEQKQPTYKWTDVVRKFGMQYGNDTFDTSLLSQGDSDKVYSLDEIANILGIQKGKIVEYLEEDHVYDEHDLEDPEGYEWADVPMTWKQ